MFTSYVALCYLFDDKLTLHINYKDGTKTVTFDEMKAALEEQAAGSDLDCRGAPPCVVRLENSLPCNSVRNTPVIRDPSQKLCKLPQRV